LSLKLISLLKINIHQFENFLHNLIWIETIHF